jgi:hypothetical protein
VTDGNRASRIARRAQRAILTIGVYLTIGIGPTLVMLPVVHIFIPDADLLIQKLISVMGGVVVVVFSGIGVWLLGALLRRRLLSLRQAENDRLALKIMSDLRASRATRVPEFYLYLRAFETTGRLHVPLFLRLRKISIGLNRLVTNDVESYVSSAIRRIAPLVALGRAGEAIGAGRIVTDDDHWKADIRVLMDRAKAILVVPSDRPGTMWEIETLKNSDLLHKVIFIMPPRSKGALDTRERWEVARQAMAAHGLDAPDYQDHGLLFVVSANGKVSNVEPMLLPSPRQVSKSLTRLLSSDQAAGGFFKAVAAAERRSRRATFWGWSETARQLSPYALAVIGLLSTHTDVGFNPHESWSIVFDRFMTTSELSQDHRLDVLAASEKYRSLEAQVPPDKRDEWRGALLVRGLPRLGDEQLRHYDVAFGEMLARVDTKICAAILRGDIQADALAIALTYLPSQHVHDYLQGGTAAILAAVDERPVPARDAAAANAAGEQFVTQLGLDGQQRFQRIAQASGPPSDEDRCWLARATYAAVASLPQPHAGVWARDVAVSALPNAGAVADAGKTSPSDHQADQRPRDQAALPPSKTTTPAMAAVVPPETRTPQKLAPHREQESTAVDRNAATNSRFAPEAPRPEQPAVAPGADPSPRMGVPAGGDAAPRPSYSRLLDDATTALGTGRFAEAGDLIDQLIRLDPARSEGWSLRGAVALNVFSDLTAARESYENALSRGGRVAFRVVHDHGAGQPPCIGTLFVTPTGIDFTPTAGEHRFQWSYPTVREAAINDVYGAQYGMFHVKAQMNDDTRNFNFVVVHSTDQKLVNRRPDAEMLLGLVNRRKSPR